MPIVTAGITHLWRACIAMTPPPTIVGLFSPQKPYQTLAHTHCLGANTHCNSYPPTHRDLGLQQPAITRQHHNHRKCHQGRTNSARNYQFTPLCETSLQLQQPPSLRIILSGHSHNCRLSGLADCMSHTPLSLTLFIFAQ
jgi:hypothetical protein